MENRSSDETRDNKVAERPLWQRVLFIIAVLLLVALLYEPLKDFGRELYLAFDR